MEEAFRFFKDKYYNKILIALVNEFSF